MNSSGMSALVKISLCYLFYLEKYQSKCERENVRVYNSFFIFYRHLSTVKLKVLISETLCIFLCE